MRTTRCFGHSFCRPSCWGTQDAPEFLGGEDLQDVVDDGGFADAWSTRDDQDFRRGSQCHGSQLCLGELQPNLLLHPRQGFLDVDRRQRMPADREPSETTGELRLRMIEGSQVDAVFLSNPISDQPAFADFVVDGGFNHRLFDAEQLDRLLGQTLL
jgi:hypothetical protein